MTEDAQSPAKHSIEDFVNRYAATESSCPLTSPSSPCLPSSTGSSTLSLSSTGAPSLTDPISPLLLPASKIPVAVIDLPIGEPEPETESSSESKPEPEPQTGSRSDPKYCDYDTAWEHGCIHKFVLDTEAAISEILRKNATFWNDQEFVVDISLREQNRAVARETGQALCEVWCTLQELGELLPRGACGCSDYFKMQEDR